MRRPWAAALLAAALTAAPLVGLTASATPAAALDNGLALTPPMGWNDWNAFGCNVSAALVEQTADTIVSSGMKDAGYDYVNIDDCWMEPQRSADGHLVPDPAKFPDGIKAVADYVHSKGLKLGIYETAGTNTCAGYPGSLGHETTDAADFASWGVDYLKYDNCNNEGLPAEQRYTAMRDALAATGRPIVFSLCSWGQESVWTWGAGVGNLWRTTGDIQANYASMLSIFHQNVGLAPYAGPGHWNDPDMLEVGNGMTQTEDRSEFSLWAEMAAPLLSGTDLRTASAQTLSIYTNRDVIAVDQDPLGKQGTEISSTGGLDVLAKPLADGSVAVALFNENAAPAVISTTASAVGLPAAAGYTVRDLWSKQTYSSGGAIAASVPGHGTVMYRVSAAAAGKTDAYAPLSVLDTQVPAASTGGQSVHVTSTYTNDGTDTVTHVGLGLSAPAGWTATPLTAVNFSQVKPGDQAVATFSLTAPQTFTDPITDASVSGTAQVSWKGGTERTSSPPITEHIASPVQAPWKTYSSATSTAAQYGQAGDKLAIVGDGTDTYGTTDQYSAIYQPGAEHDGSTTVVRVTAQSATSDWAKAGIMVRDDITGTDASPGYAILAVTPGHGYALQWDSNGDGTLDSNSAPPNQGTGSAVYPSWLKLVRSGTTVTGYYSTSASLSGATWTEVGSATLPGATATQDVGVFMTSHSTGTDGEAAFDSFTQN